MDDFDKQINKLQEYYSKDPKTTMFELREANKRIKNTIEFPDTLKTQLIMHSDMVTVVVVGILIMLTGLLNVSNYGMYFFGALFFFCGFFVGIYVKYFGLIFLFSHGMTGLFFMLSCFGKNELGFTQLLNSPILRDNPPITLKYYMGAIILLIFCGIVYTMAINIFDTIKNKRYSITIALSLFFGAILLTYLLNPIYHLI